MSKKKTIFLLKNNVFIRTHYCEVNNMNEQYSH